MPTRNVNRTGELDRFVAAKVKAGRYENASEVIRSALRAKLAAIRAAVDAGDARASSRATFLRG